MKNHPDYDVHRDELLFSGPDVNPAVYYSIFLDIRFSYWMSRTGGNSDESWKLYNYYDEDVQGQISHYGFDGSQVNWANVALDTAGIPLSFLALSEVTSYLKISSTGVKVFDALSDFSTGVSVLQGADSFGKGDYAGAGTTIGLTAVGAIPGIPGATANAVSLVKDIGAGFYPVYWTPSIPR